MRGEMTDDRKRDEIERENREREMREREGGSSCQFPLVQEWSLMWSV